MDTSKPQPETPQTGPKQSGGKRGAPSPQTSILGEPPSVRARLSEIPRKAPTPIEQVRVEYNALRGTFSGMDLLKERYVPELYRDLHMRVLTGRCTKTQRIKLQCAECMGWQNVADEVRNCTARSCHLWGARPYQVKQVKKATTAETNHD